LPLCQRALTQKQTLIGGGGALQRGHGAALESLAQLGDTLYSLVIPCTIDGDTLYGVKTIAATEPAPGQAAKREQGLPMGADREANTRAPV